jgi:hypothetical protein
VRLGNREELQFHLAPLLALAGVCASLFTDNSISYIFVMAPLGMLIGCSLSRLKVQPPPAQQQPQPVTAAQMWAAAQLALAQRRPLFLPPPATADEAEGACEAPRVVEGDPGQAKPQAADERDGQPRPVPQRPPPSPVEAGESR